MLFLKRNSAGFTTEKKDFIQHKPTKSSQTMDQYFVRYTYDQFGISIKFQ